MKANVYSYFNALCKKGKSGQNTGIKLKVKIIKFGKNLFSE